MNYLNDGYAAVGGDELARITAQIADVEAAPVTSLPSPNVSARVYYRVMKTLADGNAYPTTDISAWIREELAAQQVCTVENEVRQTVLVDLRSMAQTIKSRSTVGVLQWLQDQLDELMDKVRDIDATLGSTRSLKDAASDPAKAKAWQALTDIVGRYRSLRNAQMTVTGQHVGNAAVAKVGFTRGFTDIDYLRATTSNHEPTPIEAWPGDNGSDLDVLPSTEPEAYVRWIAQRGDAWVPTPDEIRERGDLRIRCLTERTPEQNLGSQQTYDASPAPAETNGTLERRATRTRSSTRN